jgi:hypothetical protein
MTAPADPPPEPESGGVLTKEPVRIVWIAYGFVQAVVVALASAQVVDGQIAALIGGIALAAYIAVSELYVRASVSPAAAPPPDPSTPAAPSG